MKRFLSLFLILLAAQACVVPYEPKLALNADVLIVEGTLSDLPETQFVKLSRSRVFSGISATLAVAKARVEVLVGESQTLALRETTPGRYELPAGFRGRVGERYQLRFQTEEGTRYESTVETLTAAVPIQKVYDRFEANGIPNAERTRFLPANLLYVDTPDPGESRNFYRWTSTLWERQDWCASCTQGIFLTTNSIGDGFCQTNRSIPASTIYDYVCLGSCWEIVRSLEINLLADTYSNGKLIAGRLVARLPYYQERGALVEVRQYALTVDAYRYFKLLEDQTQNTGGLADTPPAPLIGNVRNLSNANENVAGYFSAAGVSASRYWLDRRNASGVPIGLLNGLLGRPPNPEPPTSMRPPPSRCLPSDTRTPDQPEGWRN